MPHSGNLTQEISEAMDEMLPNNNDVFATSNLVKTSQSHPIKWVTGTRNLWSSTVLTGTVFISVPLPSLLPNSYP